MGHMSEILPSDRTYIMAGRRSNHLAIPIHKYRYRPTPHHTTIINVDLTLTYAIMDTRNHLQYFLSFVVHNNMILLCLKVTSLELDHPK